MPAKTLPQVTFHTRVRVAAGIEANPFAWKDLTTDDIFAGRRIILVAVPGAFTPACSNSHLPGYERDFVKYRELGVDAVYCTAVNDAFVMFQWAKSLKVDQVQMLPDGNADFAAKMGMCVRRDAQGMGDRSWRYSLYAEDGKIMALFSEPGFKDNPDGVPVSISSSENMLRFLTN